MRERGVRRVHVGDRGRRSDDRLSAVRPRSATRTGLLPDETLHPFTSSLREEGIHEQRLQKHPVAHAR